MKIDKNLSAVFLAYLLLQSAPVDARYAAIIIDAGSGRVIQETDATQPWYPASLTKVMALYLTFSALASGQIDLQDKLHVSKHAAAQPNSRLGLFSGEILTVEQAVLAVALRSANDAAVVLAEKLAGSEAHFADLMTAQAQRLGMSATRFQNASGLPHERQVTTARDMALLALALIHDFPQYYAYFSLHGFNYKGQTLPNINRILYAYPDADGMKTGFTCGSGYNLIASAKRNGRRLIGVLLGAHSSAERVREMTGLLDGGFQKTAAASALHISQLGGASQLPPPFQLPAGECSPGAGQTGEDGEAGVSGGVSGWSVIFGAFIDKSEADTSLKQARNELGLLAKLGRPLLVNRKMEGEPMWHALWTGLRENDAGMFCKQLWKKDMECTALPSETLATPDAQWR
jgi:D-alanyl-D-alanine carboxypeptidase